MSKIYVGDVGTEIILDCGVDLTTATSVAIKVKKPSTTQSVTWAATVLSPNSIRYITSTGDINVSGLYKLQAIVSMPGWSGAGETVELYVSETI